jgi:hypothetical protein
MKKTCALISVFALLTLAVYAGGPANKTTGSIIRGKGGPTWLMEFTAHESVQMQNGKTRPAKGMASAYSIFDSSRYWAMDVVCVTVIDEFNAVFAGPIVVASGASFTTDDYMKIWVYDGGEPGAGVDMTFSGITGDATEAMAFCSDPPPDPSELRHAWNVFEGNVQVHYRSTDSLSISRDSF